MAVEGAEEVAELRQQRGEVTCRRRQGGEGAEQEAQREHRRRRPHADLDSPARARVVGGRTCRACGWTGGVCICSHRRGGAGFHVPG